MEDFNMATENDFTEDEIAELSLLRSLEIDELVEAGLIDESCRFDAELLDEILFEQREINLRVTTGLAYPAHQLHVEYENKLLPRLSMDALRIDSRKIISAGEQKNNIESWKAKELDTVFDYHMTALEVLKAARNFINSYRNTLQKVNENSTVDGTQSSSHLAHTHLLKNHSISDRGVDISTLTADATASSVLGRHPEEICALIPSQFRILHVESVLRADLLAKFRIRQSDMTEHLSRLSSTALSKCIPPSNLERHGRNSIDAMVNYLTTPKMTFHGTSNRFVPSIVRHGFLAPGAKHPETHQPLPVRCGSTYGQGIYSSPSAEFSLSYSGSEARPTTKDGFWGLKLIVCATLMGRSAQMTRDDEWWTQTTAFEGADSHVGNGGMEYIVFDNAQILPCYVIHLDWGKDNEIYFQNIDEDKSNFAAKLSRVHPKLLVEETTPGDRQRQKQALMAKALKYFPYGYGPATGTRFVIEDVGEVDEDEEDYGDYQQLRVDATYEKDNFWDWDEEDESKTVGISKLDEYAQFRSGNRRTV